MSVTHPQHETSDLTITWPDMRESFPCEKPLNPHSPNDFTCNGENPAEWILRLACCGRPVFFCSSCKDRILAASSAACMKCWVRHVPAASAYTSIEPLGVK